MNSPFHFFKGNIHFGLEVAAGARARPADIVWDQVHKKLRKGSHDQHATQHFTDTYSKLALTRSFPIDYKDISVE